MMSRTERLLWLEQIEKKITIEWFIISLLTIPLLHIGLVLTGLPEGRNVMFGGFNDQALLYAFWEPFVAIGICLTLLAWFKYSFNQSGTIMKVLSNSAYSAFIIHPLILVSLTLLFRSLDLQPFIKFLAVSMLSVSISFVLSALIIKIPYVKRVL